MIDLMEYKEHKILKTYLSEMYYQDIADQVDQISESALDEVSNSDYTIDDVICDVADQMTNYKYDPETESILFDVCEFQNMLDMVLATHKGL